MGKGQFIAGSWIPGVGKNFESENPASGEVIWSGNEASGKDVQAAVDAARAAFPAWFALSVEKRISYLKAFEAELTKNKDQIADLIGKENGKPKWEALTEVGAMIGKIDVTIKAFAERTTLFEGSVGNAKWATRFKPHGVCGVFGPFNFPGSLANGHIVPALLAGNTVVMKPSELTPLVGERITECWEASGLPAGVFNMLQGARDTGVQLAASDELDGLFFTGSSQTGCAIHQNFAGRPDKILALEMGGNNPFVVWDAADSKAAAYLAVQSAFITAGQRCSCARRIIIPEGAAGDDFLSAFTEMTAGIVVGAYDSSPEPFIGPLISEAAGESVIAAYKALQSSGADVFSELKTLGDRKNMLSPAIVDVTRLKRDDDEEVFGPLTRIVRVASFEDAITEANNTRYGLAAALVSDQRERWEQFVSGVRAGVVNWNRQTTGATGAAPFGGVGLSGNHRPSGYFAVDYCSYPIASIENEKSEIPQATTPGIRGLL